MTDRPRLSFAPVRLACTRTGDGPPLVLLHAYPLDRRMFDPLIEALSIPWTVVTLDLRGFGQSPLGLIETAALSSDNNRPSTSSPDVLPTRDPGAVRVPGHGDTLNGVPVLAEGLTMTLMADDVIATLDHHGLTDPAVFLGVSMGGYVALEILRRHSPRVRGLFLCNTRATPDNGEQMAMRYQQAEQLRQRGSQHAAETMPKKLLGSTTLAAQRDADTVVARMIASQDGQTLALAQYGMASRSDQSFMLEQSSVPFVAIAGEDDGLTPVEEMRTLVPPNVARRTLTCLPAAGHLALWERPDEAAAAIRDGLARM